MTGPSSLPDLAALDLFVSTVERGSLSRAAAAHGISQPSASAKIARLERTVGFPLLRRTPRGSRPTEQGEMVAEWGRGLLRQAEQVHAAIAALRTSVGGHLRVVSSYTIAEHLLPAWLAELRARRPSTVIQLIVANSADVAAAVRDGRADLGFVEGADVEESLASEVVARDLLVVVAPPDHPWARRRTPLQPADLAATRLVTRERGSGTREVLERSLRASCGTVGATPVLELGSSTAVKTAVIGGVGPAVISETAVTAELERGELRRVAIEGLDLGRELRAVWLEGTEPSEPAQALLACALDSARRMPVSAV